MCNGVDIEGESRAGPPVRSRSWSCTLDLESGVRGRLGHLRMASLRTTWEEPHPGRQLAAGLVHVQHLRTLEVGVCA